MESSCLVSFQLVTCIKLEGPRFQGPPSNATASEQASALKRFLHMTGLVR